MAAGKVGRRLAALGGLALLAVLLGACWMLRPARLEGAVEQAVAQTRQAAQPPGADGGFQLLGVHWLEQEGGISHRGGLCGPLGKGDRLGCGTLPLAALGQHPGTAGKPFPTGIGPDPAPSQLG